MQANTNTKTIEFHTRILADQRSEIQKNPEIALLFSQKAQEKTPTPYEVEKQLSSVVRAPSESSEEMILACRFEEEVTTISQPMQKREKPRFVRSLSANLERKPCAVSIMERAHGFDAPDSDQDETPKISETKKMLHSVSEPHYPSTAAIIHTLGVNRDHLASVSFSSSSQSSVEETPICITDFVKSNSSFAEISRVSQSQPKLHSIREEEKSTTTTTTTMFAHSVARKNPVQAEEDCNRVKGCCVIL